MLRIGVIGPGDIAGVMATGIGRSGVATIGAVLGRDAARTAGWCARHGGEPFTDPEAFFGCQDIDAVYVATPHPSHAGFVHAALDHGLGVLCEKPLTVSPVSTRALWAHAERTGVPLVEAWMYRAHPQWQRVAGLLRVGAVGTVTGLVSQFGFVAPPDPTGRCRNPRLGGGALFDIGGYPLSLAMLIAAYLDNCEAPEDRHLKPRFVRANGERTSTGVDGTARAELEFENGLRAWLAVSIEQEAAPIAMIEGSGGRLEITHPFLPGGERLGLATELRVIGTDGAIRHVETVDTDRDCFSAEVQELSRLLDDPQRAPGHLARPGRPMVAPEESIAIAEAIDFWLAHV